MCYKNTNKMAKKEQILNEKSDLISINSKPGILKYIFQKLVSLLYISVDREIICMDNKNEIMFVNNFYYINFRILI